MNTFVGVRLAEDLQSACAKTPKLYGADVLVAEGILLELMGYELRQAGLNLTHSQDKDYVKVTSSTYLTMIWILVQQNILRHNYNINHLGRYLLKEN